MSTKALYQELIKETLINNKVRVMKFKGRDNFAKVYSHVFITYDGKRYSMLVFHYNLVSPFMNFYFDFTLDYARLINMIETDLFNISHGVDTQYFDFEFNN